MSIPDIQPAKQKLCVDLQWNCEQRADYPTPDQIQCWAEAALKETTEDGEVTIRLVEPDEMQQANGEWRGKNTPTNVLSFPADFPAEAGINYLGDLLICVEVLRVESEQQKKPLHAHWAHIIVHGMLHLQGYDHIEPKDAQVMEALEISILALQGIANPYES